MAELLRWLTLTHSVRRHMHYHSTGSGHVYQNRFTAFPVEADEHLYTLLANARTGNFFGPDVDLAHRRSTTLWREIMGL